MFNQLPKWQAMSAGILKMPMILRMSVGAKYGAQHSQDWVAIVSHIPGLKVFFPATPYEAKGIMQAALNGTDPCVIFESQAQSTQLRRSPRSTAWKPTSSTCRLLSRWIIPILIASVKKTGRVVLASDACARGTFLNEIAENLTNMCFDYLDAPPVVIGARNWITAARVRQVLLPVCRVDH